MTDLRQQALNLVEKMSGQNLNPPKRKIDIEKYAGSAGDLFGSVEETEKYMRSLREDDRI